MAPEGRLPREGLRAKCKGMGPLVPTYPLFFQAIGGVSTKRKASGVPCIDDDGGASPLGQKSGDHPPPLGVSKAPSLGGSAKSCFDP